MSINEDFQILAKKLDNCELLTNYNLNVLNEDMMLLQNAFYWSVSYKRYF